MTPRMPIEARAEDGGAAAACSDDTSLVPRPTLRARVAAGVSPPGCGLTVFTTMISGRRALKAWPARMTVRSRKFTSMRRPRIRPGRPARAWRTAGSTRRLSWAIRPLD